MKLLSSVIIAQAFINTLVKANLFENPDAQGSIKCNVYCTIYSTESYMIDPIDEHEPENVCEMDNIIYSIQGIDESDIDSGRTVVNSDDAECILGPNSDSGGSIIFKPGKYTLSLRADNNILQTKGEKALLIIYSIPPDHQNVQRTSVEIANDIFGICEESGCIPDPANLSSQISDCSGGEMEYIPACSRPNDPCYNYEKIVNGVLEVPIDYNIAGVSSGTVVNYNTAAAKVMLEQEGIELNDFNLLHIIPDQASWGGAAAWAYLPGTVSAFRDSYAYRMGVLMHEIGHNIGLHHSGFGSASYADHSCLMGNPSYDDDGPLICFNAAKSWETKWYENDSRAVDVIKNENFDGLLIGTDDYVKGRFIHDTHYVVLKIPDPSKSSDYYISFNRKEGMNGGVTFKADKVVITEGQYRQVSWHKGDLDETSTDFSISNFGGSSRTLVVKVCERNTNVDNSQGPDTARVLVFMDNDLSCDVQSPTRSPTLSPTSSRPTPSFTSLPTQSPPSDNDPWLISNTNISHQDHIIYVSHDINSGPKNAEVEFFLANCKTEIGEDDIVSFDTKPLMYSSHNITYALVLNENKLGSSETVKFDDATNSSGKISFCSKLTTKSSSNLNLASKKLKFNIAFDMSNSEVKFSEEIDFIEDEEEEVNLNIDFSATACECNAQFQCVSTTYTKSDTAPELKVCITPESEGVRISNLMLSMTTDSFVYNPVKFGDNEPVTDDITFLSQFGSTTMVTSKIVDDLFDGESSNIVVKGIAQLSIGDSKTSEIEVIEVNIQIDNKTSIHTEDVGCLASLLKILGLGGK